MRVPALPDGLAGWRPDGSLITAAVALLDSSEYASYDDVRHKGLEAASEGIVEDADGTLRWSASGPLSF
jgi:hypothetical protein